MTALIVEDETISARHLTQVLEDIGYIKVLDVLDCIEDTLGWFKDNPEPDLLFLDIHLADGSAFEIFKYTTIKCPVIFTTAYDEYALKAFKVNSVSYLLKPVKKEDVTDALKKVRTLQRKENRSQEKSSFDMSQLLELVKEIKKTKTHFLVPVRGDKLVPLNVQDVAAIYVAEGLVKAQTFDGKIYFMNETLDELMGQLDDKNFYRANRQFIISRNAIKDIDQWFNSRLAVNLTIAVPEKILISRVKVSDFKSWFS